MEHKPPTAVIEAAHAEHLTSLPFEDTGDAPTSVHPSLWRQSTLAAKQGLYEVVEGIYPVRGLDLSNISRVVHRGGQPQRTDSDLRSGPAPTAVWASAGPGGPGGPGGQRASDNAELKTMLEQADNRWAAATIGSMSASPLELSTGASIMSIGGFGGGDNSPTLEQFQSYVAAGQVHYFIAGEGPGGGHHGPRRRLGNGHSRSPSGCNSISPRPMWAAPRSMT